MSMRLTHHAQRKTAPQLAENRTPTILSGGLLSFRYTERGGRNIRMCRSLNRSPAGRASLRTTHTY
jgi:hypothetical protein